MKALTIAQPYASLIMAGFKIFETRTWPTSYRGRIVIHAARPNALPIPPQTILLAEQLLRVPFYQLPTRALLGTIRLSNCEKCSLVLFDYDNFDAEFPNERNLGHWLPNNYAWSLASPQLFPHPIHQSGHPDLWEVPNDVHLPIAV